MLYSTPTDITAKTTHDLWVESRQFELDIDRPTSSTIRLTVRYPKTLAVVDGLVLLVNTKPIDGDSYPVDGTQYTASADFAAPADDIGGAQVAGFWSNILNNPLPANETSPPSHYVWFEVVIENANPTTLYYASIHPMSNVLQYYPIGIQSYPLNADATTKNKSSYTGNIPSLPSAPTAPTDGMVYHDQQLNITQYWTGTQWIPTRSDMIQTGAYNPGVLGQVYYWTGGVQLQVFNGARWVRADSTNLHLRVGTGFVPLAKVSGHPVTPLDPEVGQFFYDFVAQRGLYWDGINWIHPDNTNTLFFEGNVTTPAFISPLTVEPTPLLNPYVGQLFYNTTTQKLMAWNGQQWIQANTDQEGTASSEKIAIGDDGSYDQRMTLIKILQGQLGWPQYCVELKEEQFNIAIDNALENYRQLSDGAYRMDYINFNLIGSQQRYYLNSAVDKTDRIVNVAKVHRLQHGSWLPHRGPQDVWSQAYAQNHYNMVGGGGGGMLTTHLVAQYSEELTRMFAGDYTFLWDEPSRELLITRAIRTDERVVLECQLERSAQEIMVDRWSRQFIQNWALAEAKMTLGMIRSKYSSGTPGAQGAINLNGELLVSEARQDFVELKEALLNYEYGGHVHQGNVSFLIG